MEPRSAPAGAPVGYAYTLAAKSKKNPKSKLRNAEEQSELREAELELYEQLDRKMGLFLKRVCGCWCLTPAMLIWSMNLICAAVHLCMGVVVMDEGHKNRENMAFQVVSVVGEWRNRSADGYFYTLEDAWLGKIYLHEVCAAFAFMSFGFHAVIVVIIAVPLTCLCPGCFNCLADAYYAGIYRCCIWWRCAPPAPRRPGRRSRAPACRSAARWLEYSISAPTMTVALFIVGGVREQSVLLFAFFGQSATMLTGLLVEVSGEPEWNHARPSYRGCSGTRSPGGAYGWKQPLAKRLAPFWVGLYMYVPTWATYMISYERNVEKAWQCCQRKPPDWVPVILWTQILIFSSFTFPIVIYQCLNPKYYWHTEILYCFLSLTAKVTLNGVLLAQVFLLGRLDNFE